MESSSGSSRLAGHSSDSLVQAENVKVRRIRAESMRSVTAGDGGTMSALRRANWISIGAFACGAIAVASCRAPQIVSRVDPTSIRSIKVGMTELQVTAILGEPLRIRPWGTNAVIYDYAISGWALSSPGLWIYFEKGAVSTVQGKRHRMIGEDEAVYEARAGRPTFESPDFEPTFSRAR